MDISNITLSSSTLLWLMTILIGWACSMDLLYENLKSYRYVKIPLRIVGVVIAILVLSLMVIITGVVYKSISS